MSSVNKVILIGNLGRDPEVRHNQDGSKIVQLSVATSETWRDKATGERRDRTEWHRVVVFNDRLADVAEKYLHKGSKIFVEGQLQTRKWTDKEGTEKYTTEVVLSKYRGEITMLDSRADGQQGGGYAPQQGSNTGASNAPAAPAGGSAAALDDEIPF